MMRESITSPDDPRLDELCRQLADAADELDRSGNWPGQQLDLCGRHGVYQWFIPPEHGGQGWSDVDVVRGELKLSAACLTTTFIITQRTGACRRIVASDNEPLKRLLLPDLVSGRSFATLGISHLTTSRRHLARPAMAARPDGEGYILDGYSPWVTGGVRAESIVTGAVLDDGRQIMLALPTDLPGVEPDEPARLVALFASHTGMVRCRGVSVDGRWVLAGPADDLMVSGGGATGGLQTSTLALGLAQAAIEHLVRQAAQRAKLLIPADRLRAEHARLVGDLLEMASGESSVTLQQLRTRANSLVLRSTQAALTAAKGAGFVAGHPTGRWCREALFFLVWSCPQPVMEANLCELASGMGEGMD